MSTSHLFITTANWAVQSIFIFRLNIYNSLLVDLPISTLVLLLLSLQGSTHDPLNWNLIMPFLHWNFYKLPISPKMKFKLLSMTLHDLDPTWFSKVPLYHSLSITFQTYLSFWPSSKSCSLLLHSFCILFLLCFSKDLLSTLELWFCF